MFETEETAENFNDGSLNEVQDSKGKVINAGSLEEAEENYDDCGAKIEKMEGKPELAEKAEFVPCVQKIWLSCSLKLKPVNFTCLNLQARSPDEGLCARLAVLN